MVHIFTRAGKSVGSNSSRDKGKLKVPLKWLEIVAWCETVAVMWGHVGHHLSSDVENLVVSRKKTCFQLAVKLFIISPIKQDII